MSEALLKPTGRFGVGIYKIDLFDENRPELSYPNGRMIPVQIYFPLFPQDHLCQPRIFEDRALKTFPPLKVFGHGKLANVSELIDGKQSIVIFNHGRDVAMTDYSMITEDLASHGYVVFSIQHELETDLSPPSFWQNRSILKHAHIISNILYLFEWIKAETNNLFKGKIDINKVSLMGHSMGGNALLMLSQRVTGIFRSSDEALLLRDKTKENHIKECIVFLDGEFSYPRHTRCPILFCLSEERKPYQLTSGTLDDLRKIGHLFKHYNGSRHISFMDHSWGLRGNSIGNGLPYFNGSESELEIFWNELRRDIREFLIKCGI